MAEPLTKEEQKQLYKEALVEFLQSCVDPVGPVAHKETVNIGVGVGQ